MSRNILSGYPVTLVEENRNTLSHDTTGLVSWQGAFALTAWATESEIFTQKVMNLTIGANSTCETDMCPKILRKAASATFLDAFDSKHCKFYVKKIVSF